MSMWHGRYIQSQLTEQQKKAVEAEMLSLLDKYQLQKAQEEIQKAQASPIPRITPR